MRDPHGADRFAVITEDRRLVGLKLAQAMLAFDLFIKQTGLAGL